MVNDKVGDLIIRIKNAGMVKKDHVKMPYTKFKHSIAKKMSQKGLVGEISCSSVQDKERKSLIIKLVYDKDGNHRINDFVRVSKSGKRVYQKSKEIRKVKFGKGFVFLSTPKGILVGEEAVKEKVGGETLFKVW